MAFTLPPLPFAKNALEPYISEETLNFHYGKHHNTYLVKLNELIAGTDLEGKTLEEIIKTTAGDDGKMGIFNNAAQVWNHSFYWNSIKPQAGGQPVGLLFNKIQQDFGSFDVFKQDFATAGATQFGSGWVWLVITDGGKGSLAIRKTLNAQTPITSSDIPLITMDVWEHAYYLDFQNARPKYIETFLEKLVNWDFAEENYKKATS